MYDLLYPLERVGIDADHVRTCVVHAWHISILRLRGDNPSFSRLLLQHRCVSI